MGSLKINRESTERCDVNTSVFVDTFNKVHNTVRSGYENCFELLWHASDRLLASATKAYGYSLHIPASSHHDTMRWVYICVQHFHMFHLELDFKILLITHGAMRGLAPSDLTDILLPYVPSCYLRHLWCITPNYFRSGLIHTGDRAFAGRAPRLWNELPDGIWVASFKSLSKTDLLNPLWYALCQEKNVQSVLSLKIDW